MAVGSSWLGSVASRSLTLGVAGLAALFAVPAAAQQTPQVPTRDQLQPPQVTARPAQPQAHVDASHAFEHGPCPLPADLKVTIREIRFSGLGGAPLPLVFSDLLSGIAPPAGEQPVTTICELRDQANALLRREQYVASVQIPPQRIEDGVLRLEVVAAHIVDIHVRGDVGPYERELTRRIEMLKALDPLNERDANRILLLAGDIPGLDVELAVRPAGTRPGDVIGDMTVTYHRVALIANLQNYNSTQLGRETGYLRAEFNGITGNADMAYAALSSTLDFKEQQIYQAGYVTGVANGGVTLASRFTYAVSRPDLDTLHLQTKSILADLAVSAPLVRSIRSNVNLSGGFEFAQQRTQVETGAAPAPLNLDRISTLTLRLAGDHREPSFNGGERFAVGGFLELRKGLDIFDATKTGVITGAGYAPSRFEGSATAFVVRGQADGRVALGPVFQVAAQVRGQWADRPLLNLDEFSIGNLTVGRGYDPGSNSGDRAIGGDVELRVNAVRNRNYTLQLFGFYDAVHLWNLDQNSTEKSRLLRSVGGGARFQLTRRMQLEVTYAHPLDRVLLTGSNTRPPSDRVLVSLTAQLLPFNWR